MKTEKNVLINTEVNQEFSISITDMYSAGYQTSILYDKTELEWVGDVPLNDLQEGDEIAVGSFSKRLVNFKALQSGIFEIIVQFQKPFDESAEVIQQENIINVA